MAACESPKSTTVFELAVSPNRHDGPEVEVTLRRHPSTIGSGSEPDASASGGCRLDGTVRRAADRRMAVWTWASSARSWRCRASMCTLGRVVPRPDRPDPPAPPDPPGPLDPPGPTPGPAAPGVWMSATGARPCPVTGGAAPAATRHTQMPTAERDAPASRLRLGRRASHGEERAGASTQR